MEQKKEVISKNSNKSQTDSKNEDDNRSEQPIVLDDIGQHDVGGGGQGSQQQFQEDPDINMAEYQPSKKESSSRFGAICSCFRRNKKVSDDPDDQSLLPEEGEGEEDQEEEEKNEVEEEKEGEEAKKSDSNDKKSSPKAELDLQVQEDENLTEKQESHHCHPHDEEEQKRNQSSFCQNQIEELVVPQILLFDLINPRLQFIKNKEFPELEKSFIALEKTAPNPEIYQCEVMITFWFAIESENLKEARRIYEMDPIMPKIMKALRQNGEQALEDKKKGESKNRHFDNNDDQDKNGPDESQAVKNDASADVEDAEDGQEEDEEEKQEEDYNIKDQNDLEDIKYLLRGPFQADTPQAIFDKKKKIGEIEAGIPFNTNILRIALNIQEEKIAEVLAAFYYVAIDEDMIVRAIKTRQFAFLKAVFAFNQNYQFIGELEESSEDDDSHAPSQECPAEMRKNAENYRTFTYDWLIKKIMEYCEEETSQRIKQVANWRLKSTENFLMSMLKNRQDIIAAQYGKFYLTNAQDDSLLRFALENSNEQFLKHGLRQGVLSSGQIQNPNNIELMMSILARGSDTELILNVLIFAKFGLWQQDALTDLIDFLETMTDPDQIDSNLLFKCYNPVMVLCLSCEILLRIGEAMSLFKHRGNTLSQSLQTLGEKIIEDIQVKNDELIFMDTDFKDRTVLKLITDYGWSPMMSAPIVSQLLSKLWVGKESYECNGKQTDFSQLANLATAPIRNLEGQGLDPGALFKFRPDIVEQNFQIQYKFRKRSIAGIFFKEMFLTTVITALFVFINFKYLICFEVRNFQPYKKNIDMLTKRYHESSKGSNYYYWDFQNVTDRMFVDEESLHVIKCMNPMYNTTNQDEDVVCLEKAMIIQTIAMELTEKQNIQLYIDQEIEARDFLVKQMKLEYSYWNQIGIWVSICMMFYVLTKFIFNTFATIQMPIDKWSQTDVIGAVSNIIAFLILRGIPDEAIVDYKQRQMYNVLTLLTIIGTWSRFGAQLLVVEDVSKLIMTIVAMMGSASNFMFILFMYMVVMMMFAIGMFQESSIMYSDPFYAFRTMFDGMMGGYSFGSITPDYQTWHEIFTIIHIFIANIFLLNYLVAILGSVYEDSIEIGDFLFKSNKYQYLERYYIALKDQWGYTQLVVHAPPVNILLVFLLPSIFKQDMMLRTSEVFCLLIFWGENLIYISLQIVDECLLVVYCYLRIFIQLFELGGFAGLYKIIHYLIGWIFFGPFILIACVFRDTYFYIKILCDYKMDDETLAHMNDEDERQDKIVIYNEIITVIKTILYIVLKAAEKTKDKGKTKKNGVTEDMTTLNLEEALNKEFIKCLKKDEDNLNNSKIGFVEGLSLHKDIILDAWARFRPVAKDNSSKREKAEKVSDLEKVYGQDFINFMIANFKLKIYGYAETEPQNNRKKSFKNDFIRIYKGKVESYNKNNKKKKKVDARKGIPENEIFIIENFLSQFLLDGEGGSKVGQIDIKMALKSLPTKIDEINVLRCEVIDYESLKNSLIAYSNQESDVLFKYYDNRNKTRLTKLGNKAGITKDLTHSLKETGSSVLSILKKIQTNGKEEAKKRINKAADYGEKRKLISMVCLQDINEESSDSDHHHKAKDKKK